MGHPVTMDTSHQLHALLTSPRIVLTQARRTGYVVVLSAPELNVQRCTIVNQPIPADLTLFVDGSCFRDATDTHAGYGIVQLDSTTNAFTTIQSQKLVQPCSTQLAEMKALTAACKRAKDKTLNVYTDSTYAYGVCHVHANIWKQRGFLRADGTPVTHGEAIMDLLEAMLLPTAVAVIRCPAHQRTDSLIAT